MKWRASKFSKKLITRGKACNKGLEHHKGVNLREEKTK